MERLVILGVGHGQIAVLTGLTRQPKGVVTAVSGTVRPATYSDWIWHWKGWIDWPFVYRFGSPAELAARVSG